MNENDIKDILKGIEKAEDIEILYACEAGSRVWGFAGDSSDYDIRFIYRNANLSDYLSIKNTKDVIEITGDDADIVGWDIKKALQLHFKSNPNLREWLMSPQVYIDRDISGIFEGLGGFDRNVLKNHYSSMALKYWKRYSGLEFGHVKRKKYLYVIRFILSWNLLNRNVCPPVNIYDLLEHEKTEVACDIEAAIVGLMESCEITEKNIFRLNNFILSSLNSMHQVKTSSKKNIGMYDERFRELLMVLR